MFKVMIPEQKGVAEFNGLSHGLQFQKGVSEEFSDAELKDRLVFKGYILCEQNISFDKMKKADLIKLANEKGIVVDEKENVDEIRKKIKIELEEGV